MISSLSLSVLTHGISNDSLADNLGVSRKTLFNWMEKGSIPSSALIKMADMFSCTIDYLLGRAV